MNANPTPEVGQVWADRDERTTHAEFEIVAFEYRPIPCDVAGNRERNARNRAEARRQRDTYIAAALGRAS